MSGAGNGYTVQQNEKFDCKIGIINTTVSSIDLTVLASQNYEDVLQVELSETNTVILVNGNGETLGSLVHKYTGDLIDCISRGNNYEAIITSINTPSCKIRIKRI